jgi:hypothetical protein
MSAVHLRSGRLIYPFAWAVATAVTATIAWSGIRSVLTAAAPERSAPLSVADLRAAAPHVTAVPAPSPRPSPPPTLKAGPTPTSSWSAVPDGTGGTAFRRLFHTAGGDVVVSSSPANVQIESAKPQAGYTVTENRQAGDSVIVSFVGPHHASRVWAQWNNGPYAEVTEVTGYLMGA